MSSPISAEQSCSRLSTHFVFGTMSTRVAFHEASHVKKNFKEQIKTLSDQLILFSQDYIGVHILYKN